MQARERTRSDMTVAGARMISPHQFDRLKDTLCHSELLPTRTNCPIP
ncbi:hypothetical protein SEA_EAGLEPRIDE_72 [Mycobacterium phage Eaglepride]|nr:hypothetical protein SEA_EAGLEPRIDE_72 [Mycobacterium phage Eaglepride]